jgi:oxalate---CoA ligase
MFLDLEVGELIEIASARRWDRAHIERQLYIRMAYLMASGLVRGDRVFLHYGNVADFFVDLLAIWNLGACAVPIDPRFSHFEIQTLATAAAPAFSVWAGTVDPAIGETLSNLGITLLQASSEMPAGASQQRPNFSGSALSLDAPALILFTSGTTGQPKGVVHTHRSLRARWMALRQAVGIAQFRRTLCVLPTHFGHGLICNCLYPWLSGQDLFIAPPFRTELLMQLGSLLDQHAITFMSSVPAIWRLVLKTARPPRLGHLEQVFCGSAPLSAHVWKGIQEWTGTQNVINAYGITETGSWVAGTTVPDVTVEDGLIGVPWGAVIRILRESSTELAPAFATACATGESGYVWLNTPALMQGYFGRDDLTAAAVSQGWFYTGDIGLIDDRGILYLRGRDRDEINRGGIKIYPTDVDSVAEQYEHTIDVCTFAYEEPLLGESVGIAVVLKEPSDDSFRSLHGWLKTRLAQFQMPQRWYLPDQIPRTSRGKINRTQVAQMCAGLTAIDHLRVLRGK